MVRFFTFSGALFHLFWCAFLSFSKKVKKRTKKDIILKNYLVRSVRLVRFFILLLLKLLLLMQYNMLLHTNTCRYDTDATTCIRHYTNGTLCGARLLHYIQAIFVTRQCFYATSTTYY